MPLSNKIDYAIFSAMVEELEPLMEEFAGLPVETIKAGLFDFKIYDYKGKKLLIAHTGLGTAFAACAVTLVHQYFKPEYIFLAGTAGGIKNDIKLRDVVIVEKAFEAEIQGAFAILPGTPFESCLTHPFNNKKFPSTYEADRTLLDLISEMDFSSSIVHRGTVVSSNAFPAPVELFEKAKKNDPISIDMETSAFYQVAWLLKIPALAIRGISNILNTNGTDDNVNASDVKGSAKAATQILLKIINQLISKKLGNANKEEHSISDTVKNLVNMHKLEKHPEGGFYARTFKSTDNIISADSTRYNGETRSAGSSIYYLLNGNDFSAWHRLKSDEIWHFYSGSAAKIHVIGADGKLQSFILGDPQNTPDAKFQVVIKAGNWFAAECLDKNNFCFMGCTVSPGFEFTDFELAERSYFMKLFPMHKEIIEQFTREEISNINSLTSTGLKQVSV